MTIKINTVNVYSSTSKVKLVCSKCGSVIVKTVDKSLLTDCDCVLIEGECRVCGDSFVNRFDYEEIHIKERRRPQKETLKELFKGLRDMGIKVEMNCIKTKRIKKG